jgi:hypothetical protein
MSGEPTTQIPEAGEETFNAPDPVAKVLGWRVEQLIAAGFEGDDALVLALDRSVDLHVAIELVRRGCPPKTALRILI